MNGQPSPDDDLLVFAREGDARASFLLCENLEPGNIDALLAVLAPDGIVTAQVFNGAADGYDLWREATALQSAPTQERHADAATLPAAA